MGYMQQYELIPSNRFAEAVGQPTAKKLEALDLRSARQPSVS